MTKLVKIVTHHEKTKRAAELFAEEGVIAIGWARGESIAGKTKDEIIEMLTDEGHSNPEWGASQLIVFRDEIQKGDITIAYAPTNTVALIGEVTSDYIFDNKNRVGDPHGEIDYPNQRTMLWWNKPRSFHRNLLPGDLSDSVASRGTIRILDYDVDVHRLRNELDKVAAAEASREIILEVTGEDEVQRYLEASKGVHLDELEGGLTLKESQYEISVGSIDILAEDSNGLPVVIELKLTARDSTVGQILGYLQAYEEESGHKQVRGIIVAQDFTERCKKAAKRANLELFEFRKAFNFRKMEEI